MLLKMIVGGIIGTICAIVLVGKHVTGSADLVVMLIGFIVGGVIGVKS